MTVKEYMIRNRKKQVEVAFREGIPLGVLSRYLNGWGPLPRRHQESLAKYLQISVLEIEQNKVKE